MIRRVGVLLLVVGCGQGGDPERLMDTGWFTDTASFDAENCKHKLNQTNPVDGQQDWYWKTWPTVYVETDKQEAYDAWLVDDVGNRVDTTNTWSPNGLNFDLAFDGGLRANTDYVLNVNDCGIGHRIHFKTSKFGAPLESDLPSMVGLTYHLDLVNAEWVEPGGIAGLLQLYFTTPVLFGVKLANESNIDFIAAPGEPDAFGALQQDLSQHTWDFPLTDFAGAPYFEAHSPDVLFEFQGLEVPIHDFRVAGTFAPDLTEVGGLELSGLGDTRNMGQLMNNSEEDAVCQLAAGLGVDCIACPDGKDLCLFLSAREVGGALLPGVTLTDR